MAQMTTCEGAATEKYHPHLQQQAAVFSETLSTLPAPNSRQSYLLAGEHSQAFIKPDLSLKA